MIIRIKDGWIRVIGFWSKEKNRKCNNKSHKAIVTIEVYINGNSHTDTRKINSSSSFIWDAKGHRKVTLRGLVVCGSRQAQMSDIFADYTPAAWAVGSVHPVGGSVSGTARGEWPSGLKFRQQKSKVLSYFFAFVISTSLGSLLT